MQWGHVPFSYVKKSVTTNNNLSSNLKNMSNCAFQWEISFSPDLLKPTEQIIFSKKSIKHSEVFSNSVQLSGTFGSYNRFEVNT